MPFDDDVEAVVMNGDGDSGDGDEKEDDDELNNSFPSILDHFKEKINLKLSDRRSMPSSTTKSAEGLAKLHPASFGYAPPPLFASKTFGRATKFRGIHTRIDTLTPENNINGKGFN